MQFYRGMDIGTAKITDAERRGVPHHLLDILDVTEEASVSDFQQQARAAVDGHPPPRQAGHPGGRVRAVRAGSPRRPGVSRAPTPASAAASSRNTRPRPERRRCWNACGRSTRCPPARLGDARRIIRALEVFELTGRPFSSFMPTREYFQPAVQIGLEVDRDVLRERLAERVHRMVERGLLAEVERLDAAGLRRGRTAPRALGYAQFLKVLDGEADVAQAAEETIVATRQFARRQLTWFRADPASPGWTGRIPPWRPRPPPLRLTSGRTQQGGCFPGPRGVRVTLKHG